MKREQRPTTPFACAALLACAATAFSPALSFAGTVIHVNGTTGDDANTGQDWSTAKKTVTAGLTAAVSGDQVWVAAGTYVECVTLKDGVALYGDCAGHESELSQRDWTTNKTILDGNNAGRVVTSPQGVMPPARLDGFMIRNGSASVGAGIYCSASSPTIANNTITENATSSTGGGIDCSNSSPTIAGNTITKNYAYYGSGGIYCRSASPTIANNAITGNNGAAIFCEYSSSPLIANTIVAFNSSGVYAKGSSPTLTHNCVYGNFAYDYSGLTDPTGTNGNISADPLFADNLAGDFHLAGASPCINAGDPAGDYTGQTDMDGEPRVSYDRADIGADEFLYRGPLDIDLDNDVDLTDFGFFAACFAEPNRPFPNVAICPQADLDADADVDMAGFLTFQTCFNGPNRPPACP
jgi:hypothetical protein